MAFQSLSPVAPFNAAAAQTDLDKVIILLTDGDNTENRWSTNQNSINQRTTLACNNVKAANIKLYTIRVINGNASLLRQRATKPDMYYDVQNASQLSAVFSTIAQNLANLLSQNSSAERSAKTQSPAVRPGFLRPQGSCPNKTRAITSPGSAWKR